MTLKQETLNLMMLLKMPSQESIKARREFLTNQHKMIRQSLQKKTTDDIIAEIERERDSWKHQFQSNNGRISSYQKQIQELTEKLQERANSNSQESLTEAMEDEDWIALKEDFRRWRQQLRSAFRLN